MRIAEVGIINFCHCERVVQGNERVKQSLSLIIERDEIASLTLGQGTFPLAMTKRATQ